MKTGLCLQIHPTLMRMIWWCMCCLHVAHSCMLVTDLCSFLFINCLPYPLLWMLRSVSTPEVMAILMPAPLSGNGLQMRCLTDGLPTCQHLLYDVHHVLYWVLLVSCIVLVAWLITVDCYLKQSNHYHPRMWHGNILSCLCVCLFWKPCRYIFRIYNRVGLIYILPMSTQMYKQECHQTSRDSKHQASLLATVHLHGTRLCQDQRWLLWTQSTLKGPN